MGNIPEYQRKPVVQQGIDPTLSARAQQTTALFQGVGQVAAQASDAMFRAQKMREEMQIRDYVRNANMELSERINRFDQIARKQWQKDPYGAIPSFEKEMKRARRDLTKNAPFPSAAKLFEQTAQRVEVGKKDQLWNWADQTALENQLEGVDKEGQMIATKVRRDPTPATLKAAFELIDDATRDLVNTIDPQQRELMTKSLKGAATENMFGGIFDNADRILKAGPMKGEGHNAWVKRFNAQMQVAQKHLDSKQFDEDLGPDGIGKIQKQIGRMKEKKGAVAKDYRMMMLENPWKYLTKVAGVREAPIDWSNPLDAFLNRAENIVQYKQDHKLPFLPLIQDLDREMLNKMLDGKAPKDKTEFLANMSILPDQVKGEIIQDTLGYDPDLAQIMSQVFYAQTKGDLDTVRETIEGYEFLKKNKNLGAQAYPMPKTEEFMNIFNEHVKGAIAGEAARAGAARMTMAGYALARQRENITDPDLTDKDEVLIREAFNKRFGEPMVWRGSALLVPTLSDGKRPAQSEVKNVLNKMTDEKIELRLGEKLVNGANRPVNIENNLDGVRLIPRPDGFFDIEYNNEMLHKHIPNFKPTPEQPVLPMYIFDLKQYLENSREDMIPTYKNIFQKGVERLKKLQQGQEVEGREDSGRPTGGIWRDM